MYVARSSLWYLDTLSIGSVPLVRGLALVPGVDLWLPYKHLAIPQGTLFVLGPTPTLETLGSSSQLVYREVT